jgi:hypothetical protein
MIEDGRYFTEQEVEIPRLVQAKTHKKKRINKKWAKRYGYKTVYEVKKAKIMDVTIDNVVEFCLEKQIPLPDEFLQK